MVNYEIDILNKHLNLKRQPMALYKKLTERFETSEKEPESMLWGNGTTDKRFDIAGNVFVDPTD